MKQLFTSFRVLLVLTLLTGVVYPLIVTAVATLVFPKPAQGSLVVVGNTLIGSELLAQKFDSPRYFWPRPSGADYATVPSGASNKGPTSVDLLKAIDERRAKFGHDAPADLLTASASGLDPHISPAAAKYQCARVASARGLAPERVRALVEPLTEPPQWGVFGEPRVNVFALNRAVDALK